MRKMVGKLRNKKGFTLIELIVVIAVIGILVLLAAPKFLGYTKDANVAAMQADTKALSTEALEYYVAKDIEEEGGAGEFPVVGEGTLTPIGEESFTAAEFDKDEFDHTSLKFNLEDYVIVTSGDKEGEVYHVDGVEGKDGKLNHGNNLKSDKTNGSDD